MFTVKIEDIDGNSKLFEAEEVQYRTDSFQTIQQLEDIHERYVDKDYSGTFYNHNIPSEGRFNEIKQEIYEYYRSYEQSNNYDPIEEMYVSSANIELFNNPGYTNVSVFASIIYIMNDEGQTVDKIDLLR